MKKEIKWIIIETLDITPSEFEKRFEIETLDMNLNDIEIKEIAEKCYNLNNGEVVSWVRTLSWTSGNINPFGGMKY